MAIKIKIILSVLIIVFLSACLRLDDNLFNQSKISEYKLDAYTGQTDFVLDYSYHIPDNLVHIFTLPSQAPDESKATTIYAIYIGDINKITTDTVIMYCHGNRDHMDFYWQRAKLLANTGPKNRYGVMMIDYRGFGKSEGKPSENGIYADVDAALKWLKEKGLTSDRLIMYGFSLGSAPATKLTAEPRTLIPSKLLLEAPFANAETMVQDGSGLAMPAEFFTDLKINNADEIKSVQQPFFWIHGEDDDFLNIKTHGQVVFDNYNGIYKESHRIPGAGHGTIPATFGFTNYTEAIKTFITTH
jgi:pimeloyl-ACP methyl ester carboxylesterase